MGNVMYYRIGTSSLPRVNLADTIIIQPPYIHMKRKPKEYIIYYIISGEMSLVEDTRIYNLKQNDMMILDPSYVHSGIDSTTCNFIYIHFTLKGITEYKSNCEDLRDILLAQRTQSMQSFSSDSSKLQNDATKSDHIKDEDILFPKYYHVHDASIAMNIIEYFNKIQEAHSSVLEYKRTQTSCLLTELLIILSRDFISDFLFHGTVSTPRSIRTIYEMISYFNGFYHQDISSSFIEEYFDCNFDYINRVFKKITGKSVFTYLNGLRIEKAKHLLSNRIYSLSEFSEKTGFHDVYYFSKVFKKYTQVTPGAYAKLNLPRA